MQRARIVVAAAVILALYSAWHSGGHIWHRIASDHNAFAALAPIDRLRAPATTIGVEGYTFDWYRNFLVKGDRFYVQVDNGHNPFQVRLLAGYYLLPAVEVAEPSQANVIVSYYTDPNALGLHYVTQQEAGLQPIFVSRVAEP
ncbi:MAG TPA: hypothetical protein VG265_04495 [Gaiellaceae bacterium]|jgi:hypothetical protein|nr:hypothetical protein [Gaiellaceae bacterium]